MCRGAAGVAAQVAAALSSGEISFQAASALCHLHERLGEHRDGFDEEEMLGFAREFSVSELRKLCRFAWHVANPDGFFKEAEADFTRRYFHISQLPDGMVAVDGVLDPVGGAAFKTAVDVLAKPQGAEDERTAKQRRAGAVRGLSMHAMGRGTLPRPHPGHAHLNLTMALPAPQGAPRGPPAQLDVSLP